MPKTTVRPDNMFGKKLYQRRARAALPILIRQARFARKPIFYDHLAQELSMPNARNLNYPLGSIGETLDELGKEWGEDIPHIESLVINQAKGLPGAGFDGYLIDKSNRYGNLNNAEKKKYLQAFWSEIYAYPKWHTVLDALGLKAILPTVTDIIEKATRKQGGDGGEGPEHKALKEYIRNTPHLVGLSLTHPIGEGEYGLPSGDSIDVVFKHRKKITAVEVKASNSSEEDIVRGLYQCVKYQAVLEAQQGYVQDSYSIRTLLVLSRDFPPNLIPLRNFLGVQVIPDIKLE